MSDSGNISKTSAYTCPCPNFVVCHNVLPMPHPEEVDDLLPQTCMTCDIDFNGILDIRAVCDWECPICLQRVGEAVRLVQCSHLTCPDCFRRLHWEYWEPADAVHHHLHVMNDCDYRDSVYTCPLCRATRPCCSRLGTTGPP